MWEIWKGRNEVVMNGGKFEIESIRKKVAVWMNKRHMESWQRERVTVTSQPHPLRVRRRDWHILVDGSWKHTGKAGASYIMYEEGKITTVGMRCTVAHDPFHAEALALLDAVQMVQTRLQQQGDKIARVYTYCQGLVTVILEENMDKIPAWQAVRTVHALVRIFKQWMGRLHINYVPRQVVLGAHKLANYARRLQITMIDGMVQRRILEDMQTQLEMDGSQFVYF